MRTPSRETINRLRNEYPVGAIVELIRMDDPQAPAPGTLGKVVMVDDIGTVHVHWNDGSSLGIAYGEDLCRRVG